MGKPLLLDLFCGAGGAAMGYHRAGFEVIGVDINPQPRYPFRCIQADAMTEGSDPTWWCLPGLRWNFDAIHASPPCQGYTQLAAVNAKLGRQETHAKLIAETRACLRETGLPYVIENVVGAPLIAPVRLCGTGFGLPIRRHRLFESNIPLTGMPCHHERFTEKRYLDRLAS